MRLATRAGMRLRLDDLGYPGLWFDVRAGLTNAEQLRATELFTELQGAQAAREAGDAGPVESAARIAAAQDAMLRLLVVGTNLTEDEAGNPLPQPTDTAFWEAVPDDIKTAIVLWYNAERERRLARVRDFTEQSSSPS